MEIVLGRTADTEAGNRGGRGVDDAGHPVRHLVLDQEAAEHAGCEILYVWIGGTFAFIYTIVERINVQAFRHVQFMPSGSSLPTVDEWRNDIQQMLYYSFVTQTTLGFGDIVPVTHIARVLTITQAVIGQFYVAVIMAYILSLWIHNLGGHLNKDGMLSESKENHGQ